MMERRKFDNWVKSRQNIVGEGFMDRIFGRKQQPQSHEPPEPEEPSHIYAHPTVEKYHREVLDHLLLNQPLEIINGSGQKTGDYHGKLPPEIDKALRRFVASHTLGGEKSFLRVNQHDAILILNYMDRLRVPGEDSPLTDRFGITNPVSFSQWMETHVPVSLNVQRQMGFAQASGNYVPPRDNVGAGSLRDPRIKKLVDASLKVINGVSGKMETSSRRITKDIIDGVKEMRGALAAMNIIDDAQPTTNTPPPDPYVVGKGRPKPKQKP
jgi:hypothetical protein